MSKIAYEMLIKKWNHIKKQMPNSAYAIVHEIDNLLTPEERN